MAQENTIEPSPELKTADKACDDLSWGFLDKPPTTGAAVAALLTYAEEHLAVDTAGQTTAHTTTMEKTWIGSAAS